MNIPSNLEISGITCGGCHHAISNHKVSTSLNSTTISGKCKICGCTGVSFAWYSKNKHFFFN